MSPDSRDSAPDVPADGQGYALPADDSGSGAAARAAGSCGGFRLDDG